MTSATLAEHTVLVTGGGAGIGRATCEALAAAGARVAVCDVDEVGGRETLERLDGSGSRFYRADVTVAEEVGEAIDACVRDFGALDGVHNNAGVANSPALLDEITEAEWDRVVRLNLRGAWLVLRYSIAQMRAQGHGAIVNTASIAATHAFPKLAAYCASKAGVVSLTEVAAAENGAGGIHINAVAPGMVATGIGIAEGEAPPPVGPDPSGRYADPAEVAAAVCWLLSDSASYVNGVCLPVDGGWSALASPRRPRR
jgi:NAD(P)-dependent dehydrogenase (short-subunit alcohol dehydrogenase family)